MARHAPLRGIRIVDLTDSAVGAEGTAILSSLGADVSTSLRVDHRAAPDERTVTLRRDSESETLPDRSPAAVEVVLSPFDSGGGGRHSAARQIEAAAGLVELTGGRDGPPAFACQSYVDVLGGAFTAAAVLTALRFRSRVEGRVTAEVDQHAAALQLAAEAIIAHQFAGGTITRRGNRHPVFAPHGVYPCRAQRWIAIAVDSDQRWRSVTEVLGRPDWARSYDTLAARRASADEIDAAIAAWTSSQDAEELVGQLQRAGVAAGIVLPRHA